MPNYAAWPRQEPRHPSTRTPILVSHRPPLIQNPSLRILSTLFSSLHLNLLQFMAKPANSSNFNYSIFGWLHAVFPSLRCKFFMQLGEILVLMVPLCTASTLGVFLIPRSTGSQIPLQVFTTSNSYNPHYGSLDYLDPLNLDTSTPILRNYGTFILRTKS